MFLETQNTTNVLETHRFRCFALKMWDFFVLLFAASSFWCSLLKHRRTPKEEAVLTHTFSFFLFFWNRRAVLGVLLCFRRRRTPEWFFKAANTRAVLQPSKEATLFFCFASSSSWNTVCFNGAFQKNPSQNGVFQNRFFPRRKKSCSVSK